MGQKAFKGHLTPMFMVHPDLRQGPKGSLILPREFWPVSVNLINTYPGLYYPDHNCTTVND